MNIGYEDILEIPMKTNWDKNFINHFVKSISERMKNNGSLTDVTFFEINL